MRRRGFSAVEALASMGLSVMVIGGAASLYVFSMRRATQEAMKASVIAQAQTVADDISRTVKQAVHCDSFVIDDSQYALNGAQALRCAMPENYNNSSYTASYVSEQGEEAYVPGRWVWYLFLKEGYEGDPTKRFIRTTTTSPEASDLNYKDPSAWDPSFTMRGLESWRFEKVTGLTSIIDSGTKTVSVTVRAQSTGRIAGEPATGGEQTMLNDFSITRSISWRNGLAPGEKGDGGNELTNGYLASGTSDGWKTGGDGSFSVVRWPGGAKNAGSYLWQSNIGGSPGKLQAFQEVTLEPDRIYVLSFSAGSYASDAKYGAGKAMRAKVTVMSLDTKQTLAEFEITDPSSSSQYEAALNEFSFPFRTKDTKSVSVQIEDLTGEKDSDSCDLTLGRFELRKLGQ